MWATCVARVPSVAVSRLTRYCASQQLPREVTNDQIHARFSKIGKPNLPEGEYMATVEFVHSTAARKAVQKLHRRKWHGMPIVVRGNASGVAPINILQVSFSPWDMPTGKRLRPAAVRA
ncbi:hypothetical protein EXIGLDRAFT_715983, partial [Exidia glandulosa HHB12029]